MDINVHVTFDASDKLAHLIQTITLAVSHCGKPEPASAPEHQAAYEVSATPELVPTTAYKMSAVPEPAPKSEPAPEPAPEPALTTAPTPAPTSAPTPAPTSAPTPAPAPAPAPASAPAQNAEKAKTLTIDDVRRVCLRATKAGKTKVVTDFLDAQGVKNLPALDPKLYDALVTVVEDNL